MTNRAQATLEYLLMLSAVILAVATFAPPKKPATARAASPLGLAVNGVLQSIEQALHRGLDETAVRVGFRP